MCNSNPFEIFVYHPFRSPEEDQPFRSLGFWDFAPFFWRKGLGGLLSKRNYAVTCEKNVSYRWVLFHMFCIYKLTRTDCVVSPMIQVIIFWRAAPYLREVRNLCLHASLHTG